MHWLHSFRQTFFFGRKSSEVNCASRHTLVLWVKASDSTLNLIEKREKRKTHTTHSLIHLAFLIALLSLSLSFSLSLFPSSFDRCGSAFDVILITPVVQIFKVAKCV